MRKDIFKVAPTIVFSPLFLLGCSGDELSRSEAESLIRSAGDWPNEKLIDFPLQGRLQERLLRSLSPEELASIRSDIVFPTDRSDYALVMRAKSAGMLKSLNLKERFLLRHYKGGDYYLFKAVLDSNGEKYARGEEKRRQSAVTNGGAGPFESVRIDVLSYADSFGGITGIAYLDSTKSKAKVEFTEVRNYSPFNEKYLKTKQTQKTRTALLALYDDGWRVEVFGER